jgi:hypothetical protein
MRTTQPYDVGEEIPNPVTPAVNGMQPEDGFFVSTTTMKSGTLSLSKSIVSLIIEGILPLQSTCTNPFFLSLIRPLNTGLCTTSVQPSAMRVKASSPPEYLGLIFIKGRLPKDLENPSRPGKRTIIRINPRHAQIIPAATFTFFMISSLKNKIQ